RERRAVKKATAKMLEEGLWKTKGLVLGYGMRGCWSEILTRRIPLRILTFSSIDSMGGRRWGKARKPSDAAPQNHFEKKFKFFREKLAKVFSPPSLQGVP
ncbi:hypothetical protein CDAR_543691, partial [Caerostris darwini]